MSSTESRPLGPGQIASALAVGTLALLMIGLQPILLGELVEQKRITLEGVGIVAMGEIVTVGLGVILGDALLSLSQLRLITVLAALFTAVLDIVTGQASGDTSFAIVRALAGLSEGVLVWVTTCVIVRSATPDRLASIFLVVQTLAQATLAAVLAIAVIPRWGWAGGFAVLAAVSLLACALSRGLPAAVAPLPSVGASRLPWSLATVLTLVVVFMQMAAIGSLWAYLEPLGKQAGFDAQSSQTMISGVLLMQVIGGAVAAVVIRRLGAGSTLLAGTVALAAVAAGIHFAPSGATTGFAAMCALFGFAWLFLMPFHIRLAFRADATGRVAVLVPAMQLLGSAFGPLVASFIVTGEDARPVPMVCAAFAAATAVALLVLLSRRQAAPALATNT
ncbi:MFS transporter [Piscinibacter terrae]|uniref:MFS transporter n=1 Tax=Piscinibacter terrae TaxID=2496871 RepID=A0A3N7HYB7_9BURK|nr:MFS transporter [Albitalea terrae]RQP26893.1 MFS transporter [Albitalea terrae]